MVFEAFFSIEKLCHGFDISLLGAGIKIRFVIATRNFNANLAFASLTVWLNYGESWKPNKRR